MSRSQPIRILSLTRAEDRHTNAQQVNAREIAARLDPKRFEVTLLSDGRGTATILDLPHVRALKLPRRLQTLVILHRLISGGFDLVLYPGPAVAEAVWLGLPRLLRGRTRALMPVEGDLRQFDEVPEWIRRRVDRLHLRAHALFPITKHVAESLRLRTGRTGSVVPVGVDLEAFAPRSGPRRPGPIRVLSVGTVKPWKRPDFVREAAAASPDASFLWIGDGDWLEAERRLAPRNLEFRGACARDRLPDVYRDADLLLHPSRMEGLPKVILEALATGLPVVVFDDYRPRYLVDGGAGFVVKSQAGMLEAVRRLISDDELRRRMGEAARRLSLQLSWEIVVARWTSVFEREAALSRRG